jgi:uncharacterized protein (TIGR03437 family)
MRNSSSLVLAILSAVRCLAVPLAFEQRDATHFLARFSNGTAELRRDGVSLGDVTLHFVGCARAARLEGIGHAAPSTYLRAGYVRTFPQFPRLAIRGLYPGVDAIFYGSGANLEYDLQLTRGASIDRIRISVEGAGDVAIDDAGNLTIRTAAGVIRQMRPHVFQTGREVSANYVLLTANEVGLRIGKHDPRAPLTIDPVLSYVKTFGTGGSNIAALVTTDSQGNIYIAGQGNGLNFPTTSGSFDPSTLPTLRVLSNAGQNINPIHVPNAFNVGTVGATPDGGILYAGTSQGILLSGNGGATWTPTAPLPVANVMNYSPTISVNAFSIDPLDPATILVATNVGLFGTDSGGEFWGARTTGLNVAGNGFVSVVSAFYHPLNPLIAFAVTSGPSYLYTSVDAGNTWQRLQPTYPGEPPAPQFSYSPNQAATITPDGKTLYDINGNGTLLSSPDGGNTWVKLAQGFVNPTSIQVDPSNLSNLYVLDYYGLHKSTDGGATFAAVTTPVASPRSLAVDSTGSVYLGGFVPLLYVSTDGTKTFAVVPNVTGLDNPTLSASGSKVYVGSSSVGASFVVKLDPTGQNILYSTFLGGTAGDSINGLAIDAQGNAVLVGTMNSPDFPLTAPASSPPAQGKSDGFLTKLSADGTHLIYSTALGASKSVSIQAVTLDSSGAVYITGESNSADFQTTPNAFQSAWPSTLCSHPPPPGVFGPQIPLGSAFLSKITANGTTPVYTTFLTGSCGSYTSSITVDQAGDAVVTGYTPSPDFPVSANSYQSSFLGSVASTGPGAILNAGFLAKISPAGDKLLASTLLGGGYATVANSSVLDASGNAFVTGFTQGFATGATPGAYQTKFVDVCTPTFSIGPGPPYTGTGDAFVLELDASFSTAHFMTYLGGSCNDSGGQIALDPSGNIWIAGSTSSPDFPLKGPFQGSGLSGSPIQGFVSELSGDGSQLLFSSYSEASALALGPAAIYLAGWTGSAASIAKIDPAQSPATSIDTILPVVAFPPSTINPTFGGVAPGQLIQISGRNLGPANLASAQVDASGHLPFVLANTVVLFDNVPAPLVSVSASSIICYVPFEVVSTAKVTVSANGQVSNPVLIQILASSPQILAVVNQDGSVNSAAHPAKAGSVILLYVSGLGQTNPPGDDGLVNASPLPVPLTTVLVNFPVLSLGITPQFAAAAPGMIAGITQVNVQLPATTPSSGTTPFTIGLSTASAKVFTTQ